MTLTKNITFLSILIITLLSTLISPDVFAAGGLDSGITATSELKTSAYKWLAIVATGYIIFNVVMAYLGRKGWGDVAMAVMYCAIAGGAIALGDYAWSIFS
ncbi:conjugal transfer protein TraC [Volucribacter amazonae]|uniref:Conjugal transfer protein TraC n=1 Tax=Volucribacter amazonae TaxID=256731 RepID=A0A9X4PRL9_9PAST|nr:conjugal transfer protein TraC [Volucribacter amazonae]MDG6896378.1 conjugal transfer protein TraC [Volucribacter amazonae]MDG6896420.1 conjugal transfer protein TraC [Volucribacter amazonae]